MRSWSVWRGRLLALLLGLAVVAGAEVVLRLLGYEYQAQRVVFRFLGPDVLGAPQFVRDRRMFWRLKPGGAGVSVPGVTNSDGFRGPSVPLQRTAGIPRVACLGDSITYGVGLPVEKTYVAQVGMRLEWTLGARVEMVNGGCPGYSSFQGLRLLESKIVPMAPDVVTLLFGAWNDFTPAIGGDDEAKGARWSLPPWTDPLLSVAGRSRLFMAMTQAHDVLAGSGRDPRFGLRTTDEYLKGFARGRPPEGERVPLEKFQSNLVSMVRMLRGRGVEPVLMTPPLSAQSQREYPIHSVYRETVHEVARAEHVKLVQVAEHLAAWEGRGEKVFADWVHPNAFGHEIVGVVVSEVVAEILRARAAARPASGAGSTAGSAGGP